MSLKNKRLTLVAKSLLFVFIFTFCTSFDLLAQATTVNASGGEFASLKSWMITIFGGLIALWFIYMIGSGIFKLSSGDEGNRGLKNIVIGCVGLVLWKLADTFLNQLI